MNPLMHLFALLLVFLAPTRVAADGGDAVAGIFGGGL